MGRYLRAARAMAGFLSVVALLSLVVGEFYYNGNVRPGRIPMLLALIAALLGVDLLGEFLPLQVTVERENAENDENDA